MSSNFARTLCLVPALALGGHPAAQSSFTGLGDLPGGISYSVCAGISPDGSTLVGTSGSVAHGRAVDEAFLYSAARGIVGQGTPSRGSAGSFGLGVSVAGAHFVGKSIQASGEEAFENDLGLGDLPGGELSSSATAISDDGSVIAGTSRDGVSARACVWKQGSGPRSLGDLPGPGSSRAQESRAEGISGDGRVVVGYEITAEGREAFRWDPLAGMVGLGDLPGGRFDSVALASSRDGSVIVGESDSGSGISDAFRWTAATGMVSLSGYDARANACSADGSIVVGRSAFSGDDAMIWDARRGLRPLRGVLESEHALAPAIAGWTLDEATGISADGSWICGNGYDPRGDLEAWVVHLDPSAISLHEFPESPAQTPRRAWGSACAAGGPNPLDPRSRAP